MANAQAVCTSFKAEVMTALHAFGTTVTRGATTADSLKAALYVASGGTQGAATTAYSATGEVSGTGYTAGGVAVTNANAPSTSGTAGIWTPSASIVYSAVTLSSAFDCCLLYNSTQSNRAIATYTFTAQTITAGTLTLTMPTNAPGTALLTSA